MKNRNSQEFSIRRRALFLALTLALPLAARAANVKPPNVPANLAVPAGNQAFLIGHATGTQNYVCLPSGSGFAFVLYTPVATLFDDSALQVTTHFFTPNPDESGTVRPTWQSSIDTSSVWCVARPGNNSADPAFVAAGSIPWLLLTAVGNRPGPYGGGMLADVTFIHRVNTLGGVAPSSGCSSTADVGKAAYVPYAADYVFYRPATRANFAGPQTIEP